MKKLCIFTLYSTKGASSKYRILQFENDLGDLFETESFSFWPDSYVFKYMGNKKRYFLNIAFIFAFSIIKRLYQLLLIASKSDIVFFQKACIPKFPFNFPKWLKRKGKIIVLDVDDAVYLEKGDCSNEIAKYCDCVICGNDSLKEHYSKFCKNTIVIPTVEDTRKFKQYIRDTFNNKTIGWIGSKDTVYNIGLVADAINELITRHPDVKFKIISDTAQDFTKKIKNCELILWSEESYIKDMSEFSVGIMPLYDTPHNHGKCGFKLVQYMNLEKPVVASNIGVNLEIVGHGGKAVNTTVEWVTALEELLFNEKTYRICQEYIRKDFLEKYHYNVALEMLKKALQ